MPGSLGLESGRNYMVGCPDKTTDLAIARMFKLGGTRTAQIRIEMYNAFNVVVYNARQTQLQLVSPTNQTIRKSQFLPDGTVDPTRDHERRVWRRDRRASAQDDPGAAPLLVLIPRPPETAGAVQ